MDPKIKGALLQVSLKSASHLAFIIARHLGIRDATLRANPWYAFPIPGVAIPTDDFVTCLGVPAAFLIGSRVVKDERRSENLEKMAGGSLLTGGSVFLDHLIMKLAPKALPPVRQYEPGLNGVGGRPAPPYAKTESLPFQSDLTW